MKKDELLGTLTRNYFIIFTIIILGTAALNYDHLFTFREIMLCAIFALAGDLPVLVYYSKRELTFRERRFRQILHLILLEIVILTFGALFGQIHNALDTLIFGLEILGIFGFVTFITWKIDSSTADNINRELKKLHQKNHPSNQ